MNDAAAFKATYSDWKLVKTRGVVQVIFEVPLAEADLAYKVVGGMPDAAAEKWFAVARLKPESEVMSHNDEGTNGSSDVPGRSNGPNNKTTAAPSILPSEARPATNCMAVHMGGEHCVGLCLDSKDCSGQPLPKPLSKRNFNQLSPAEQAGILCADKSFQKFLDCGNEEEAAEWVRQSFDVPSRSQLKDIPDWRKLVSNFRAWQIEPMVVG